MANREVKLSQFADYIKNISADLSPPEIKKTNRKIGILIRRKNQQRMLRQIDGEGKKWKPRIARRIRNKKYLNIYNRKKMMLGLRQSKRIKITASENEITVGFSGRDGAIAKIHHFGEYGEISKNNDETYKYPERELLSINDSDKKQIKQQILQILTKNIL